MQTQTSENTPKPDGIGRILALAIVIALIIIGALASCSPAKKAVRQAQKAETHTRKQARKNARKGARLLRRHDRVERSCTGGFDTVKNRWCMDNAPVKIGPGKIMWLPGKPIHDTLEGETKYVNCDSLKLAGANTSHVGVPCPPSTHTYIVDTFKRVDTFENTNKVKLLEAERIGWIDQASKYKQKYENEQRAHAETQAKVSKRNYWIGGLGCFCLLLLFLLVGGVMGKISHPIGWFKNNG